MAGCTCSPGFVFVSETANLIPDDHAPYVGASAFTHKAGLHVSALRKSGDSYQHVMPEKVGNQMRVLVSELAGRGNIAAKLSELGLSQANPQEEQALTLKLKEMESLGYQYEGADGSFELLVRRTRPGYQAPFEVLDFLVLVEKRSEKDILAEATVKALGRPCYSHRCRWQRAGERARCGRASPRAVLSETDSASDGFQSTHRRPRRFGRPTRVLV